MSRLGNLAHQQSRPQESGRNRRSGQGQYRQGKAGQKRYQPYSCQGSSGNRDGRSDSQQQQQPSQPITVPEITVVALRGHKDAHPTVLASGGSYDTFFQHGSPDAWVIGVIDERYRIEFTVPVSPHLALSGQHQSQTTRHERSLSSKS